MPTTCDGLAGLIDSCFLAVFAWRPPMMRSYSRPSSLRTFSMAARMRRALSGLLKSTIGSFLKVVGMRGASTGLGVVVVTINASFPWELFSRCSAVRTDADTLHKPVILHLTWVGACGTAGRGRRESIA